MVKKIVRWITFDLCFALIPFAFTIILRALTRNLTISALSESPEILFFSIMVSSTATGDLYELASPIGWGNLLRILFSVMLFGAIFSAILYGCFLYDIIIGPGSSMFRQNLWQLSLYLTIALTLLGLLVEILVLRVETA